GNCTFCNRSCIEMLGYNDESELLGKNMHDLIHHTRKDGTPLSASDCIIQRTFTNGKGTRSDNEIFWRSDGTYFDVEYYSYPQIKNGEIIGSVITFMDITERKQREAEIQYLYFYDPLTGLQNRRGFDENQAKVDIPENLPLSIIFIDLNELKLTNDIFGHLVGDELLKKSADVLKRHCRKDDIVARIGGDEFVMLLPKTDEKKAKAITAEIKASFENVRVSGIKLSVSIGLDTKNNMDQALDGIMASAENAMYKDKAMNRTAVNKGIIDTLIDELHAKSPREKMHSIFVREMCTDIGTALQLPQTEISKLSRAGYLHDIGKIVLDDDILLKDTLSEDEFEKMQQHSAVGFRILNLFDDTLDLAEYVFGHHERWDGSGYPRGLKGEQIPLISRIISVAETYERVLNRRSLPLSERKKAALKVIEDGAGSQFDPHIVDVVLQLMQ
ncbi:MAG: diguanylate cyclase, partial [Clostridiales bacterium]|nr:diguanylate cyclase [Clostridiales bacterium]